MIKKLPLLLLFCVMISSCAGFFNKCDTKDPNYSTKCNDIPVYKGEF